MLKHHITQYTSNGKRYVESWLQINVLGKCICFSKKRVSV